MEVVTEDKDVWCVYNDYGDGVARIVRLGIYLTRADLVDMLHAVDKATEGKLND